MSRGTRTTYPDTGGFDSCQPYSGTLQSMKSSSGTSASSCSQPAQTQRYPQTTSARKKNGYDQQTRLMGVNQMFMAAEPCLNSTFTERYQPNTTRTVSPYGGRNTPSSARPVSPRGCPPPNPVYKPRAQVNDDCEPPASPFRAQKMQVKFGCDPSDESRSTRASQPRAPRSPKTYSRPTTPVGRAQLSAPQDCRLPYKEESRVADTFDPEELNALFGKLCPNLNPEERNHCTFQEYNEDKDEGFLAKIMKKIKGPPNACPLKVDFSHRKPRNYSALVRKKSSCFSKTEREDHSLNQLDELWNPDTFMRWKCIDNWDQHKESLWRSVIQAKLDCPEAHNRSIEDMMYDAFKAMNAPGGECISFRMIYGLLRRNEDMYLNPYINQFTDEQFLKLIVALNRFYLEDKDKRKAFFDHPPPTFIEKIMMKETLGVLDPSCPTQIIARRFWELLLDWYAKKIAGADDYDQAC